MRDKLGSVATRVREPRTSSAHILQPPFSSACSGNALLGLSWLDPAAALVVAAVAVKEGGDSWRGDGCCASC